MRSLRIFLQQHRHVTALLIALTLAIKILVPTGYMVGQQSTVLTIAICADATGAKTMKQIVVPHSGQSGNTAGDHGKSSAACPYAGLGMASLPGADTLLLALALAFILALGFAPPRAAPLRRIHALLPPLRGPPAFIQS